MTPDSGPNHPFPITGAVLNFCNPEWFPHLDFENDLMRSTRRGPHFEVVVGIHPKKAAIYMPAQWGGFLRLLCNPRVSAISEVGFDFSVPKNLWHPQEELFNRILSMGTLGRILVMHLRGAAADPCGSTVNRLAIRLLKKKCLAHQRIHLHYFSVDAGMVRAWVAAFPHCYFGVSGLIQSFNRDQLQAVRKIPLTRLLLETDSLYLRISSCMRSVSTTLLCIWGMWGQHPARVRGMALPDVTQVTYANAVRLYA
ncbi:putative deoxyribonuclease TATDN2 [Diadema setosum]|uniref:putative deoxyribonuclease TATDN2 n=1 Tax=Diadema setosum TaxID=31175 RepID=UPI003B39FE50